MIRLGILSEANCGLICLALHTADSMIFLWVRHRIDDVMLRLNPIVAAAATRLLLLSALLDESDSVVGLLLPHLAVVNGPDWLRVEP